MEASAAALEHFRAVVRHQGQAKATDAEIDAAILRVATDDPERGHGVTPAKVVQVLLRGEPAQSNPDMLPNGTPESEAEARAAFPQVLRRVPPCCTEGLPEPDPERDSGDLWTCPHCRSEWVWYSDDGGGWYRRRT